MDETLCFATWSYLKNRSPFSVFWGIAEFMIFYCPIPHALCIKKLLYLRPYFSND